MKLAFSWWWNRAEEIYPYWRDGLRAAIEEIGKNHEVDMYLGEVPPREEENYEAILFWGDSNCPFFRYLPNYKGKKGIILTTDPQNIDNLKTLDIVFCESEPVYEACRRMGVHATRAFGTDTDFYQPDPNKIKDIPYFYPATFSPWKRQHDIAHFGNRLYCVGTVQPDGHYDLERCKAQGVNVATGYFKAEYIRDLYQRAQQVIIPAVHGSERTVLEAMACGILPSVTNPANVRTKSYVKEYLSSRYHNPREFVERYYSHTKYAKDILKGFNYGK